MEEGGDRPDDGGVDLHLGRAHGKRARAVPAGRTPSATVIAVPSIPISVTVTSSDTFRIGPAPASQDR